MILIKKHDFIKHEKFLDVCIEVTSVYDYGHGLRIRGNWWNIGFVDSQPINCSVSLNIAKNVDDIKSYRSTDLSQWLMLSYESFTDQCFRNSKWINL